MLKVNLGMFEGNSIFEVQGHTKDYLSHSQKENE